ncbi:nuclease [Chlorella sorokiniana]|uniref:Nuclease n=1 Tax=Chlorella sorokiniana TaxID=3076 RepID=A0A2P6TIZ8_CHLSO|nr:nuclease [Chlorella sorokiniana]|eukprot:PRW39217.1 nuclease [Chlorella sorokiniana]
MLLASALPLQPCARAQTPRRRSRTAVVAAALPQEASDRRPLAAAASGCLAAAAALLLNAAHPFAADAKELIQGYPRVVDGDTLDFSGTRVRMFGIDAPETKQSCSAKGGEYLCGQKAKEALAAKIGKAQVQCEQKNRDKYGRIVGVCSIPEGAGRQDLNAWMVQEGFAVAYRQYGKDYVPLEEAAQAAKRGIWSGSFEIPAKWRQSHPRSDSGAGKAAPAAAAAPAAGVASASGSAPGAATAGAAAGAQPPPGCAIKGNITAKGEKIYHVPGGSFYDRTKIELEKGERFFCSAAEAEAAGWRPSRS